MAFEATVNNRIKRVIETCCIGRSERAVLEIKLAAVTNEISETNWRARCSARIYTSIAAARRCAHRPEIKSQLCTNNIGGCLEIAASRIRTIIAQRKNIPTKFIPHTVPKPAPPSLDVRTCTKPTCEYAPLASTIRSAGKAVVPLATDR